MKRLCILFVCAGWLLALPTEVSAQKKNFFDKVLDGAKTVSEKLDQYNNELNKTSGNTSTQTVGASVGTDKQIRQGQIIKNNTSPKALQDENTGKWGFVGAMGDWVIAPQYDEIWTGAYPFYASISNLAVVSQNKKWGCINKKGEWVSKPVFVNPGDAATAARRLEEGELLGKTLFQLEDSQTGKYGFVNIIGNWAILPNYDNVWEGAYPFYSLMPNLAVVSQNKKWGCINKKGEWTVKPVFTNPGDAHSAARQLEDNSDLSVPASQIADYQAQSTNGWQWATAQLAQSTTTKTSPTSTAGAVTPATNSTPSTTASVSSQPVAVNAPTLKIISAPSKYDREKVVLKYESKASDGSAVQFDITIDGIAYNTGTKGIRRASNENEIEINLPLKNGTRIVSITAKDKNGLYSAPVNLSFQYTGEQQKPALHTLAVGVGSYSKDKSIPQLKYAAKDARDFAAAIKSIKTDIYRKIEEPVVITDELATTYEIETAINKLINSTQEDDVVMLFFSGHGEQNNGRGFFLSHDTEIDNLRSTALKFSDIQEDIEVLTERNCKVIVFLDACHAGGLSGKKAVLSSIQFSSPGAIVYRSSTESQLSQESKKYANGVFTGALVDALKGKAKDEDGFITTLKLDNYIKESVIKETNGAQSPTTENKQGEYILF